MKYFYYFFCSSLFFSFCYGGEKLTNYDCKTEKDAVECNSKCQIKKFEDYHSQISFDVNVEKNLVMWTLYNSNKKYNNGIKENCKVINSKNWICEDPIWAIYSKSIMSNNIYTSITYKAECKNEITSTTTKEICKNPKLFLASCAR